MQLSIRQTQELLKIIDKNQLAVIGQELGSEFLTDADKTLLRAYGINPEALFSPELSSIQTSFHFGMLAEALGAQEAKTVSYTDLKQYVKEGKYLPVSEVQKVALQSIKMQTYSTLKTMGGNIFSDVNNVLIDKTRAGQQEFIAKETKAGIEAGKSIGQIAHAIAEKTGDWNRNFDRIIETSSQTAFETGKAAEIQRRAGPGNDPLVGKHVMKSACKHCIRLYLTNGLGSQPIIFKLSELINNGSNIGRRVADWKATLDALHPHCRCMLFEVPQGYLWNKQTQSFSTVDPEYKIKTAAQRPLIKVTIGSKVCYL